MIASVLGSISDFMYTYVLVALLIGVGLYFFVFTRALPLRMFGEALRASWSIRKRKAASRPSCSDGLHGLARGRR